MADFAEGLQRRSPDPRLLSQLPTGGGERSFSGFDLASGELPKAPQQSLGGAPLDEPPTAVCEDDHRRIHVGPGAPGPRSGNGTGIGEFPTAAAGEPYRTAPAGRSDGETDRLAQFHHGFVETACTPGRQERFERRPQPGPDSGGSEISLLSSPSGGDPESVRLERDLPGIKGQARDGPRDVGAHSGKRLELWHGAREGSSERLLDPSRGGVQVSGPGVVPGALPFLQHFLC